MIFLCHIAEEKNYETESAFYRYGFADLTGLSDLIRVRQNTPAFKVKRKYGSGEFTNHWFSRKLVDDQLETLNMRETKILRMTKS